MEVCNEKRLFAPAFVGILNERLVTFFGILNKIFGASSEVLNKRLVALFGILNERLVASNSLQLLIRDSLLPAGIMPTKVNYIFSGFFCKL